jgi:hypothetical protein
MKRARPLAWRCRASSWWLPSPTLGGAAAKAAALCLPPPPARDPLSESGAVRLRSAPVRRGGKPPPPRCALHHRGLLSHVSMTPTQRFSLLRFSDKVDDRNVYREARDIPSAEVEANKLVRRIPEPHFIERIALPRFPKTSAEPIGNLGNNGFDSITMHAPFSPHRNDSTCRIYPHGVNRFPVARHTNLQGPRGWNKRIRD